MAKPRIILSDSSLNCYGYRVLTEGIDIESFKKNPIMLYMHSRDEDSHNWGYMAIGHWEDIEVDGDKLLGTPIFDKEDDISKKVAAKFEAGTFRAASIGIQIIETSEDKSVLVPGQTRATVTRCRLMECSIVDIPANANAVRLYDRADLSFPAACSTTDNCIVPEIKPEIPMNLKASWKTVLAFLKIGEDKAESTTLSAEQMESLNAEMERLQGENARLTKEKEDVDGKLKKANEEIETLKNNATAKETELSTLKSSVTEKDIEINHLKEQVQNLKGQPAEEGPKLSPETEPANEDGKDDLAAYCEKSESSDYAAMTARLKEEGLI